MFISNLTTVIRATPIASAILASLLFSRHAAAQLLQWEITGQVTSLEDPDNEYFGTEPGKILGDVRIGDPIRGTVYYDRQLPTIDSGEEGTLYLGEPSQPGPRLVVENPRDQTELEFSLSAVFAAFFPYVVNVSNDRLDESTGETFDETYVEYLVDSPATLQGLLPAVTYAFRGQDPLDDESLPAALSITDWPTSEVEFLDLGDDFSSDEPVILGGFRAEILAIHAVPEPAQIQLILAACVMVGLPRAQRKRRIEAC